MIRRTLPGPVIQAPMAGGPGTPELVAAVGAAGGLGFLAGGYLPANGLAERIAAVREHGVPFGVNLFVPRPDDADPRRIADYASTLRPEADRLGRPLGDPVWTDDEYEAKMDLLVAVGVPLVSFAFGCPSTEDIEALHGVGSEVLVTVTSPAEASVAADRGADGVVAQGIEAGGHRGGWLDGGAGADLALLPLVRLLRNAEPLPVVAAGGIADADAARAALAAGAVAVAAGTAFLRCPEAGTHAAHADALVDPCYDATTLTRAFSGRPARGLVNRFIERYDRYAPAAYPQVNRLTAPLRAASAAAGDPSGMNLWAGQAHRLARAEPAAEIVRALTP